eukprot:11172452-Lingulodinium_polyedra.AAC.1
MHLHPHSGHCKSSSMPRARIWAANSPRITTRGNFDVIILDETKVLPRLSVIPPSVISPRAFCGHASPNRTTHRRVANISSAAIALKGSPRAKTP